MEKLEDTTYGTCKIDSKSRITLPPKVMKFLKTSPGDLISIEKDEKDCLCLHKAYIYVKRNNKCNHNRENGGSSDGGEEKWIMLIIFSKEVLSNSFLRVGGSVKAK